MMTHRDSKSCRDSTALLQCRSASPALKGAGEGNYKREGVDTDLPTEYRTSIYRVWKKKLCLLDELL
jgi:hypothetical protein